MTVSPGSTQIMEEIKQSNNLVKLIKDEVLILSNTSNPEGILVYSQWPQRVSNHYVIKATGRIEMTPNNWQMNLGHRVRS